MYDRWPCFSFSKTVRAVKIKAIIHQRDLSAVIVPEDGHNQFPVDKHFMRKFDPKPGGYVTADLDAKELGYMNAETLESMLVMVKWVQPG